MRKILAILAIFAVIFTSCRMDAVPSQDIDISDTADLPAQAEPQPAISDQDVSCEVSACCGDGATPTEPGGYTVLHAYTAQIDDGMHDADVVLHKVVFTDNAALTEAVNDTIYAPFYSRYLDYTESYPVNFNFFRGENLIYADAQYLSVASLSYRAGTYVVFPFVAAAVVDLEKQILMTDAELLAAFDTSPEAVKAEIEEILPQFLVNAAPMAVGDLIGAYLNEQGELITIYHTEQMGVDPPTNPSLCYNVSTKALCHYPLAESFSELEGLFQVSPT